LENEKARIRGVFSVDVAPPHGAHVYTQTEVSEFTVVRDGYSVLVRPKIISRPVPLPSADDGEGRELLYLVKLVAEIARETEHRGYFVGTKEENKLLSGSMPHDQLVQAVITEYLRFRFPAEGVLRHTLAHLREKLDDCDIVVDTAPISSKFYFEDGMLLVDGQWLDALWSWRGGLWLGQSESLDYEVWSAVGNAVVDKKRTSIEHGLLLDAERSLRAHDYTSSVIQAATASEVLVRKLVHAHLVRDNRLPSSEADSFVAGESKRALPSLLAYFCPAVSEIKRELVDTFEIRNGIVHGKRRAPVTRDHALDGIKAARRLLEMSLSG
jgi:hypothetical protein